MLPMDLTTFILGKEVYPLFSVFAGKPHTSPRRHEDFAARGVRRQGGCGRHVAMPYDRLYGLFFRFISRKIYRSFRYSSKKGQDSPNRTSATSVDLMTWRAGIAWINGICMHTGCAIKVGLFCEQASIPISKQISLFHFSLCSAAGAQLRNVCRL